MTSNVTPGAAADTRRVPVDWTAVPARVADLVDDEGLLRITHALVEDEPPPELSPAAHAAVLQALAQSTSPGLVGECLRLLLDSRPALQHVSEALHDLCLDRA